MEQALRLACVGDAVLSAVFDGIVRLKPENRGTFKLVFRGGALKELFKATG